MKRLIEVLFFVHVALASPECKLEKGKVIEKLSQLSPYFDLTFDIKPFAKNPGYRNIIHVTIGNDQGRYGDRNPAVYFYPSTTRLHICSAIDGNSAFCWNSPFELPLNQFTTVRISQTEIKGKAIYRIFINSVEKFSKENSKIQYFQDVKVYAAGKWYDVANAVMKNYKLTNNVGQCSAVILDCKKNCPTAKTPVCGSNGKTYENLCTLSVDACKTESEIKKDYDGECDPCKRNCPTTKTPLCGSNGKTYENLCALEVDVCETKTGIKKDYDGKCDCSTTKTPVCGSNGKTYENLCELEVDACETESEISKDYDGECVNSKCVFPFVYKGVTYRKCTKVDLNKLWCSLDAVYDSRYEMCQPTRTTS